MSYPRKIDVLELIIEMLMDHEKRLNELIYSLDILVELIDGKGLLPEISFVGDISAMDANLEDMR